MRKRDFDIVFSGLSLGNHHFTFELDDTFFAFFEYGDHRNFNAVGSVLVKKHNTFLELEFGLTGTVEVTCDKTGEDFQQKIENSFDVVVKFGDEYNDEDDERLILPFGDYKLNVAQYLYELAILAIPLKNVHPNVLVGEIDPEYLVDEEPEIEEKEEIDPRWDKLKDLLN